MTQRRIQLNLSTYLNLAIGAIFAIAAVVVVFFVNSSMRHQALVEAESKARILLDRTLATHDYFSDYLKPHVFALSEGYRDSEYFDPVWMSSTYANRMIDQKFGEKNGYNYYFKNCAINARSPENEANEYEKAFIQELNTNPDLVFRSYTRIIDDESYFVVLRRGETMRESCLRCHSTPANAPKGLVDIYGPNRSFKRNLGEVISAQSIRVPLANAYAQADRFSVQLSAALIGILFFLFAVQYLLYRNFLLSPVKNIHDKAVEIAAKEEHLGEKIDIPPGRELAEMAEAFNKMSVSLRHNMDHLEEKVEERTAELESALKQVKTLSGFLPICASCKKIRDDEGYWNQIESYIAKHSEVSFSHSICPDCAKELYPDEYKSIYGEEEGDD